MKIEIKSMHLGPTIMYDSNQYPNSGIFAVRDHDGGIETGNVVFVDKQFSSVIHLSTESEFNVHFKVLDEEVETPKEVKGAISEDLFLKAMSLLVNKEESYKK